MSNAFSVAGPSGDRVLIIDFVNFRGSAVRISDGGRRLRVILQSKIRLGRIGIIDHGLKAVGLHGDIVGRSVVDDTRLDETTYYGLKRDFIAGPSISIDCSSTTAKTGRVGLLNLSKACIRVLARGVPGCHKTTTPCNLKCIPNP